MTLPNYCSTCGHDLRETIEYGFHTCPKCGVEISNNPLDQIRNDLAELLSIEKQLFVVIIKQLNHGNPLLVEKEAV